MSKTSSKRIEALIKKNDWPGARAAIRADLKRDPNSHWLLARLALTHYEERDYEKALELEIKGLDIAPGCPLLCWGYAESCSMLDKNEDALAVYGWLIERGIDDLAYGECGEGRGWARALLADCHYRSALCYQKLGKRRQARAQMKKHLEARGPGCRSIYPIGEVRKAAKRLGV